jgi:hypothetical protein
MTFVFYGILPLGLVLYVLGTPLRLRHNKEKEAAEQKKDAGIG